MWEPALDADAYVLQMASPDPAARTSRNPDALFSAACSSSAAALPRQRGRGSPDGAADAGRASPAGDDGFRTVYRGPDTRFAARGLAPATRYRLRVRAESSGGVGNLASRWSYPEAELVTRGRLPLRSHEALRRARRGRDQPVDKMRGQGDPALSSRDEATASTSCAQSQRRRAASSAERARARFSVGLVYPGRPSARPKPLALTRPQAAEGRPRALHQGPTGGQRQGPARGARVVEKGADGRRTCRLPDSVLHRGGEVGRRCRARASGLRVEEGLAWSSKAGIGQRAASPGRRSGEPRLWVTPASRTAKCERRCGVRWDAAASSPDLAFSDDFARVQRAPGCVSWAAA